MDLVKNGKYIEEDKQRVCWYKDGKLHREDDLPAIEYFNGSKNWFQNGKYHRENGPAIELYEDGFLIEQHWMKNGQRHREDGPAIIVDIPDEIRKKYQKENKKLHLNGCHWWINNQHHRDDGPASEYANGDKHWYKENMKHREDGPAVERIDGTEEWWVFGMKKTGVEYISWLKLHLLKENLEKDLKSKEKSKTIKI